MAKGREGRSRRGASGARGTNEPPGGRQGARGPKSRGQGLDAAADPRAEKALRGGPGAQQQRWPGATEAMRPRPDHGEDSYVGAGKLDGRVALVTGGDSGIGRAVAIAFAREGADVAIAYYDEHDDAQETVAWILEAGRRALAIPGDLSEQAHCRAVLRTVEDELGPLDVLVNNAAFQMEQDDIADITADQLERTFRTNFFAYFWLAQAALERMDAGDVILNTGSVTALEGNAGLLDYAATKGAIHAFTKSLAQAVADRGIRVNCVAPGPVWTPLIPATLDEDHVEKFGGDTIWKRAAQPAEIAPTYVFLASADGRYYSGEIFAPTGRVSSR
jgi:NAD(P)-dependent dehydrogenase (short-subunit alcohol dehydrogenase family)